MNWLKRFKRWILCEKPRAIYDRELVKNPLREFIYLDEVSLRSLLSSKKGEMTSTTISEVSESVEAEVHSSASAGKSGVGKAEFGSRFQTRNSSTLQTAKKATVQSWFRELDKIANLRTIETVQQVNSFQTSSEITACGLPSVAMPSSAFKRGELVEFRVRLAADPIFHVVTLISELKAMADDYPSMIEGRMNLKEFGEVEGIARVLQRLLAGLIPIRAIVIDYVVVVVDDIEYAIHKDAIADLDIEHRQLEIGCVTELDAYWKDIRRVLFSDAEFTMLCRVSEDGIRRRWNPVKLADVLKKFVPNLSEILDNTARVMFAAGAQQTVVTNEQPPVLREALKHYASAFSKEVGTEFSDSQRRQIERKIVLLEGNGSSASGQVDAFKELGELLCDLSEEQIEPDRALELREEAREATQLRYFGGSDAQSAPSEAASDDEPREERFLDVEVVAMYW